MVAEYMTPHPTLRLPHTPTASAERKLHFSMSTTPQEDWRKQALRQMEHTDQPIPERKCEDGWLGTVALKMVLLIVLSVPLVWIGGFGWLFAIALVAWYLFWPR